MAVQKQSPLFFDAPASLLFFLISLIIFLLSKELFPELILFFSAPSAQGTEHAFAWTNPVQYIRFLLHVFGNSSWAVFTSNLAFILLLGPQLEQRFGSFVIVLLSSITALVSGLLNASFSSSLLMGGTGIAFMMILLVCFTSIDRTSIPLSFLCASILFLCREIYSAVDTASLSNFSHLAGGLAGSAFAFTVKMPQSTRSRTTSKSTAKKINKPEAKSVNQKTPRSKKGTQWEDVTTIKM